MEIEKENQKNLADIERGKIEMDYKKDMDIELEKDIM